ncbi:aquaporinaquaporin-5-like [Podarcis lilfordi]|uniref:Aquaporinaquaporin-5-like n=1 Tax=Podarcis lilfordi TaxID=74358 RepID=A0AA35JSG1_9SAUR|nr:aquaporinaquaporin-5-like [Podarcis lilfordi]
MAAAAPPRRQQELFTLRFTQALACEFVATVIFIFIVLGSAFKWPLQLPSVLQISMAFGLTIGTLVQAFGHVSGSHVNPAVTIAYFVGNQISIVRSVLYVVLQLLGAVTGAGIIYSVTPKDVRHTLALNDLTYGTNPGEALVVEIILTFSVVMCIFSATDKRRTENRGNSALSIGLAVTMAHLIGIYYTGCSLNPARSFGPAVIMGKFSGAHWVFWLGPIFGASVASVVYNYLLYPQKLSIGERLAIVQGFVLPEDEGRSTPGTNSERLRT